MRQSLVTVVLLVATFAASAADTRTFSFGGRQSSCKDAATYRDGQLYADFASAIDNFNATREARINATIAGFKADVVSLTEDIEKADTAKQKKIAVAVAGIVLGKAADKLATVGVKQTLSAVEKQAMKAVANRGAEWTTVFLKYGATGDVDVTGIVGMPLSLLLSFSPFGAAEKAWSLGNAGIDVATAVAEAEIIKGEAKLTAAATRTRAEALAKKLQMPKISEINRLKNEIDRQCG